MAKKETCTCLFCNHPVVKKLLEFYCLIWGVIGLLFLLGMIWTAIKFKTWEKQGFFRETGLPRLEEGIQRKY